jgi:PKHD-type hydroxylase
MNWPLATPLKDNTNWIVKDDIFSDSELDEIIELGSAIKSSAGTIDHVTTDEYRKSSIAWLDLDDTEFDWIYATLAPVITEINDAYYRFDLKSIQALQFTKYTPGGVYKPHQDIGRLRPTRKLSFSIQLSDQTDYQGGELRFLHLKTNHDVAPRTRGKTIFFPSWMTHEITPVTSGTRYSLVGWIEGPLFR